MAHLTQPNPNFGLNFQTFFSGWLSRQLNFIDQLISAIAPENIHNNEQHQNLIDQVLSHYQQYYEEKSLAAREDVFLFISPPWFSSYEITFLWLGGFRPSLLFKLLNSSVKDLTEEQEHEMEQLKGETRREERELSETMARLQERIAAPPLFNLARNFVYLVDGEVSDADAALRELQAGMLLVLEAADGLRGTAMRKIMQNLSPIQTVKLLTAAGQFQLRVRRLGVERDQQTVQ
ncbi:hypothetical protein Pint_08565 [Pistacia integerrima]|uniref:Uncharacterized protein n=1 Tax=Pistacia integerrima TaxID=434235 RepID=A0ACC0XYT7_9ROSI|nr:hypothetical protein Pint_08565 [Pistacia integerrima]